MTRRMIIGGTTVERPTATGQSAYYNETTGLWENAVGAAWVPRGRLFEVYRSTTQTGATTGAFTRVNFQTEISDADGVYDNVTNFNFICPSDGSKRWQFNATARFQTALTSGNLAAIALYKNGAEWNRGLEFIVGGGFPALLVSACGALASGDTVDVRVFHNFGADRSFGGIVTANKFSGHEIG